MRRRPRESWYTCGLEAWECIIARNLSTGLVVLAHILGNVVITTVTEAAGKLKAAYLGCASAQNVVGTHEDD